MKKKREERGQQYSDLTKSSPEEVRSWSMTDVLQKGSKSRMIGLSLVVLSIGAIFFLFIWQNYILAGWFGIGLFLSLVLVQGVMINQLRNGI
jgi:hypothetical protein